MQLLFEITNHFEQDLKKFNALEQSTIEDKINFFGNQFINDPAGLEAFIEYDPFLPKPPTRYTSSLCKFRIDDQLRLFATFDDDPIFYQAIITLLGCFRKGENYQSAVNDYYEFLYGQEGLESLPRNDHESN